jgi:hypothetical protein
VARLSGAMPRRGGAQELRQRRPTRKAASAGAQGGVQVVPGLVGRFQDRPDATAQYLLEGSRYALEQCGLLLRDAVRLFRTGSHRVFRQLYGHAAFAREELGPAHESWPRCC